MGFLEDIIERGKEAIYGEDEKKKDKSTRTVVVDEGTSPEEAAEEVIKQAKREAKDPTPDKNEVSDITEEGKRTREITKELKGDGDNTSSRIENAYERARSGTDTSTGGTSAGGGSSSAGLSPGTSTSSTSEKDFRERMERRQEESEVESKIKQQRQKREKARSQKERIKKMTGGEIEEMRTSTGETVSKLKEAEKKTVEQIQEVKQAPKGTVFTYGGEKFTKSQLMNELVGQKEKLRRGQIEGEERISELTERRKELKETKGDISSFLQQSKEYESYLRKKKRNLGTPSASIQQSKDGYNIILPSDTSPRTAASVLTSTLEEKPSEDMEILLKESPEISESAIETYEELSGKERQAITAQTLMSTRGKELIGSVLNPTQETEERAFGLGLTPAERVGVKRIQDIQETQRAEERGEKVFGMSPTYASMWKQAIFNPVTEVTAATAGGAALGSTALSSVTGSTLGKTALTGLGIAGVGSKAYRIKSLEEAGKHEEAVGEFAVTVADITGAAAGAKLQSMYQKPKVDFVRTRTATKGIRKDSKAYLETRAGGRQTPMKIQVTQNKPLYGSRTFEGRGFLQTKTFVQNKQFSGTGEFSYGFPGRELSQPSTQMFGFKGKVTNIMKSPSRTVAQLKTNLASYTGKAPYTPKTVRTTGVSSLRMKTPQFTLSKTGSFTTPSGKSISTGASKIYNFDKLPSMKFTGATTGQAGGGTSTGGGTQMEELVSLKGTFFDTTGQAATQVGQQAMSSSIQSQFAPSPAPTVILPFGGQAQKKRGRKTQSRRRKAEKPPAEQPTLEETKVGQRTTPITSPARDVDRMLSPSQEMEELVGAKPSQRAGQTPVSRTKVGEETLPGEKVTQKQMTEQDITRPTVPQTQAQPFKFDFAFPRAGAPPVAKGLQFARGRAQDVTRASEDAYRPSVGGALSGETVRREPKKTLSGFEIRFPVRKKKKRKSDRNNWLESSGEV